MVSSLEVNRAELPSKCDVITERFAEAERLVALGVPITKACQQAGLKRETFYFRRKSAQEKARATNTGETTKPDDAQAAIGMSVPQA